MMRATFLVLLLGLAGCASPLAWHRPKLSPAEMMAWSTYPVLTGKSMATCFLVGRKDPRVPGGLVPTVITSGHILKGSGKGRLYLPIRTMDAAGDFEVAVLEVTPRTSGEQFYVRHPRYDVAAFDLPIPPEASGRLLIPLPLDERAIETEPGRVRVGDAVLFVGFPEVLPGTPGAFPILRGGRVASYPAGQLGDEPKFLVNADVFPGDSGAPVFVATRGRKPRLVGIISERVGNRSNKDKLVPFAVAIEAQVIRETIARLAERELGNGSR